MKQRIIAWSQCFSLVFALIFSLFGPAQVGQVAADKGAVCGAPGKDGPLAALSGVVNTYYPGAASVTAGETSIPIGAARAGGGPEITAGDLLLVIQMQGADLDSSNDERYGDGAGTAGTLGVSIDFSAASLYAGGNLPGNFSAGVYEYVVAAGPVAGGAVPLTSGLENAYYQSNFGTQGQRRFQVIRVPQYSSAVLGGTVTALRWNGATGGVLALDVAGQLDWAGQVLDVAGMGFRGGAGRQLTGGAGANTDYRTLSTNPVNGSKGEGLAGTPRYLNENGLLVDLGLEGYPDGSYGRGAPGNAGGGGTDGEISTNRHNSGGGGGANGGYGGMGGDSWFSELRIGGFGGAPFPGSAPRLVLGGGGGAGTTNNGTGTPGNGFASSGAAGGGLVMLRTGTLTGAGTINASGASGYGTVNNDGGGGGGAGGSVLVVAQSGGLGDLTVNARGGNGGMTVVNNDATHHGPGGGGGGGFVLVSGSLNAASSVAGGVAGLSYGTTPLPTPQNYGATNGGSGVLSTGILPASLPSSISGANCPVTPQIFKTTGTPLLSQTGSGTNAIYTLTVTVPLSSGWATGVEISDPLPAGLPGTITYASTVNISLAGAGITRTSNLDPTPGTTVPTWGVFDIPPGGAVTITFIAALSAEVPLGLYQNPARAQELDPQRVLATAVSGVEYDPASSSGEDVRLVAGDLPPNPPDTPTPPPGTAPGTPQPARLPIRANVGGAADALPFAALSGLLIPVTGFPPGRVSELPPQPASLAYSLQPGLTLRIPALRLETNLLGVPLTDDGWDVSWLGDSVGYLNGTAFPSWQGNSVLTGHVIDARGLPGPFYNLAGLQLGDQIQLDAFGHTYTYLVREVYTVQPDDPRPLAHKSEAWLTLITCKDYEAGSDSYRSRTIVQARMVEPEGPAR